MCACHTSGTLWRLGTKCVLIAFSNSACRAFCSLVKNHILSALKWNMSEADWSTLNRKWTFQLCKRCSSWAPSQREWIRPPQNRETSFSAFKCFNDVSLTFFSHWTFEDLWKMIHQVQFEATLDVSSSLYQSYWVWWNPVSAAFKGPQIFIVFRQPPFRNRHTHTHTHFKRYFLYCCFDTGLKWMGGHQLQSNSIWMVNVWLFAHVATQVSIKSDQKTPTVLSEQSFINNTQFTLMGMCSVMIFIYSWCSRAIIIDHLINCIV